MFKENHEIVNFIRSLFGQEGFIPLHEPRFIGNEKKYLEECIDSTFVSSVGKFVDRFEEILCEITGSKYAIACTNGTAALHMGLILAGVEDNDEVITQALTFVATANAINYQRAHPIFLDSASDNLGLCPKDLENFLSNFTEVKDGRCINKKTGRIIRACVPMHTFGHPVQMDEIKSICEKHHIFLVEDAAESIGSYYKNKHTGTIAGIGVLSFNGNKTVTAGGGGALLIQDETIAKRAKHLTTTSKVAHKWDFFHDEVGYNYRMPNLNAALICAQLENLDKFIENKRETANKYRDFFKESEFKFVDEPKDCKSSFWLNAIICKNISMRNEILELTNAASVMTRPVWKLMPDLPAFKGYHSSNLQNSRKYADCIINLPSSVRL
jgi:aminotransferase in exopolysaccharide biosynthesis